MADEKTPLDHALDVLVYAPFGLALSVRDLLPQLAERGRQQLTGQVTMAKMVGQFAVQQGQSEAEKAFGRAREQAQSTLEQLGRFGAPAPAPADTASPSTNNGLRAETKQPAAATQPPPTSGPGAVALAIPDYDSLSASQVVPRLQGLSGEELEAVRRYESDHRGRRTILNRITQLQG
jgi:hypothetical protein